MRFQIVRLVLIPAIILFLVSGCVSLQGNKEEEKPPVLTEEMSTRELVEHATKFGGDILENSLKILKKRDNWDDVRNIVEKKVYNMIETASPQMVLNALALYQASTNDFSTDLIRAFLASNSVLHRQIGWQMAARYPSHQMSTTIEEVLSKTIWDGDEKKLLIPEMAQAVRANQLKSVYTLVRRGLLTQGSAEFAKAMLVFEPEKASADFMDYLAQASVEDLRQLNQKTVNLHTCLVIMRHLMTYPVSLAHPKFSHLFLYSVSRNQALAEMANAVLEQQIPNYKEQLAIILSRLPVWIQIAYVEGVRENMNTNLSLFLRQLKTTTSHKEVMDEIDTIRK